MPRSPKGRAAARGLDARLSLQQAFMPAGDASLKQLRSIKMLIDSNHGIYRDQINRGWRLCFAGHAGATASIKLTFRADHFIAVDGSMMSRVERIG